MGQKLNVGCGRDVREGWVNLDHPKAAEHFEGIDVTCDIDQPDVKLPFDDDTFDVIEVSHVLEHITHILPVMEELWRVASPEGLLYAEVPFGASDDAFEDPTHVRNFFPGSWAYFSAPIYWRSDYGYRGDWQPQATMLLVDKRKYPLQDQQSNQVIDDIITKRNVVHAMKCVLKAIKPARDWTDEGGMDRWETRVVFTDLDLNDPEAAREQRIAQQAE